MRTETQGQRYVITFDSLNELAQHAAEHFGELAFHGRKFTGVYAPEDTLPLARDGWTETLPETLSVAEAAIAKVEQDTPFETFVPEYGVTGCEVDVARFLSGEPECMVDYPLVEIVRAGRIITLCASVSASSAVSTKSIITRGRTVVALAFALERLGYGVEIWADMTAEGGTKVTKVGTVRTLVKSAHDVIDPERLLYALAHPSMLRVLSLAAMHMFPAAWRRALGVGSMYGHPRNPVEDLPDGTLYMPCVRSSQDVPDLDEQIINLLQKLEILPS